MFFLPKPKLAIALGSGGGRGWAHIGVLKVFEREKIKIDAISGTSSGALVAAFYAAGKLPLLEEFLLEITDRKKTYRLFDFSYAKSGFMKGYKISQLVERLLGPLDFADLKIPLILTSVDLLRGEEYLFNKKDLKIGIRASISVPGIMHPVSYDHRMLIDGGVLNPVPVSCLRQRGYENIIAVDLSGLELTRKGKFYEKGIPGFIPEHESVSETVTLPHQPLNKKEAEEKPKEGKKGKDREIEFGIYDIMFRSLSIMQNKMHYQSMHEFKPRLVISPRLNYFKFLEFHRVEEAIVEGERAAYEKLTSIRKCQQPGLKNFFQ